MPNSIQNITDFNSLLSNKAFKHPARLPEKTLSERHKKIYGNNVTYVKSPTVENLSAFKAQLLLLVNKLTDWANQTYEKEGVALKNVKIDVNGKLREYFNNKLFVGYSPADNQANTVKSNWYLANVKSGFEQIYYAIKFSQHSGAAKRMAVRSIFIQSMSSCAAGFPGHLDDCIKTLADPKGIVDCLARYREQIVGVIANEQSTGQSTHRYRHLMLYSKALGWVGDMSGLDQTVDHYDIPTPADKSQFVARFKQLYSPDNIMTYLLSLFDTSCFESVVLKYINHDNQQWLSIANGNEYSGITRAMKDWFSGLGISIEEGDIGANYLIVSDDYEKAQVNKNMIAMRLMQHLAKEGIFEIKLLMKVTDGETICLYSNFSKWHYYLKGGKLFFPDEGGGLDLSFEKDPQAVLNRFLGGKKAQALTPADQLNMRKSGVLVTDHTEKSIKSEVSSNIKTADQFLRFFATIKKPSLRKCFLLQYTKMLHGVSGADFNTKILSGNNNGFTGVNEFLSKCSLSVLGKLCLTDKQWLSLLKFQPELLSSSEKTSLIFDSICSVETFFAYLKFIEDPAKISLFLKGYAEHKNSKKHPVSFLSATILSYVRDNVSNHSFKGSELLANMASLINTYASSYDIAEAYTFFYRKELLSNEISLDLIKRIPAVTVVEELVALLGALNLERGSLTKYFKSLNSNQSILDSFSNEFKNTFTQAVIQLKLGAAVISSCDKLLSTLIDGKARLFQLVSCLESRHEVTSLVSMLTEKKVIAMLDSPEELMRLLTYFPSPKIEGSSAYKVLLAMFIQHSTPKDIEKCFSIPSVPPEYLTYLLSNMNSQLKKAIFSVQDPQANLLKLLEAVTLPEYRYEIVKQLFDDQIKKVPPSLFLDAQVFLSSKHRMETFQRYISMSDMGFDVFLSYIKYKPFPEHMAAYISSEGADLSKLAAMADKANPTFWSSASLVETFTAVGFDEKYKTLFKGVVDNLLKTDRLKLMDLIEVYDPVIMQYISCLDGKLFSKILTADNAPLYMERLDVNQSNFLCCYFSSSAVEKLPLKRLVGLSKEKRKRYTKHFFANANDKLIDALVSEFVLCYSFSRSDREIQDDLFISYDRPRENFSDYAFKTIRKGWFDTRPTWKYMFSILHNSDFSDSDKIKFLNAIFGRVLESAAGYKHDFLEGFLKYSDLSEAKGIESFIVDVVFKLKAFSESAEDKNKQLLLKYLPPTACEKFVEREVSDSNTTKQAVIIKHAGMSLLIDGIQNKSTAGFLFESLGEKFLAEIFVKFPNERQRFSKLVCKYGEGSLVGYYPGNNFFFAHSLKVSAKMAVDFLSGLVSTGSLTRKQAENLIFSWLKSVKPEYYSDDLYFCVKCFEDDDIRLQAFDLFFNEMQGDAVHAMASRVLKTRDVSRVKLPDLNVDAHLPGFVKKPSNGRSPFVRGASKAYLLQLIASRKKIGSEAKRQLFDAVFKKINALTVGSANQKSVPDNILFINLYVNLICCPAEEIASLGGEIFEYLRVVSKFDTDDSFKYLLHRMLAPRNFKKWGDASVKLFGRLFPGGAVFK